VWSEVVVEEELEVGLRRLGVIRRFSHNETFSFTRIRLVKTENLTAYVTVNCKLYKSAIALYYV
jgi:hypothetical protein